MRPGDSKLNLVLWIDPQNGAVNQEDVFNSLTGSHNLRCVEIDFV